MLASQFDRSEFDRSEWPRRLRPWRLSGLLSGYLPT